MRFMLVLALLIPATVSAQTAASREKDLRIPAGQVVRLTMEDGKTIEGALKSLGPDAVVLGGPYPSTHRRDALVTIEKQDGVLEGALAGAAIVGVPTLFAGTTCFEKTRCTWAPTLVAAGVGALIGMLVDASTPWKVVYRRPGRTSVSPIMSRGAVGFAVTVRNARGPQE